MPDPLPVPPGWRAVVIDTIERLERRAAQGETFARLALAGWYDELRRIEEHPNIERMLAAAEQAGSTYKGD